MEWRSRSALTFLVLMFTLCCVPCAAWPLTLVHSQDTFGAVVAVDASTSPCRPVNATYVDDNGDAAVCMGGVARRAAVIGQIRASNALNGGNTLVLDTGNVFSGGQYFVFSYEVVAKFTNAIGYDVLKLDLRDMLAGIRTLSRFIPEWEANGTHVVSSNLIGLELDPSTASLGIEPYTVLKINGEMVGFAGTMPNKVSTLIENAGLLDSTDEVAALQVAVASMQNEGVNKIVVAVSSIVVVNDLLARVSGIDVILVQSQYYANNNATGTPVGPYPVVQRMAWKQIVCIVGAGVWGTHLGKLDIEFNEFGVVENCTGDTIALTSDIDPNMNILQEVASDYNQSAGLDRIIGVSEVPLDNNFRCVFGECGIGSWTADRMRAAGRTNIAFINGGAIERGIDEGNITAAEFVRAFPYPNDEVYKFSMLGKHLLLVLEHAVSLANETSFDLNQGIGRFLQIAGLRYSWNRNEEIGMRIVDVWVSVPAGTLQPTTAPTVKRQTGNDIPLEPTLKETRQALMVWEKLQMEKRYTITTLSFLARGLDGYTMITQYGTDFQPTGATAETVILAALDAGTVTQWESGRIVNSTATRRTCIAPGSTDLCSNSGDCNAGVCSCTSGTTGQYCNLQSSSGSDNTLAIVLGVILPLTFLLVVLAIIAAVLIFGYMRYRRPKLILKEPNYQMLVWRRDSMEGEVRMLTMRRLNLKAQNVLKEFLMDPYVVQVIGSVAHADPSSMDEVAAAMVLVHQSSNMGAELVRLLIKNELLSADDEKVLFREESPGIKAFSVFSRMVGLPYLWNTFAYPIAELELANNADNHSPRTNVSDSDPTPFGTIFSITSSVELNPKLMEEGQDNFIGRLQLELLVQKLFTRILDSLPHFPLYMRDLCRKLYEDMRYDHPDYIHRVFGNLIFLRFICPALLVPQNYGLVKQQTHPKTHRTLILMTKVLQNLANKNEFSNKEAFMESMNGFINRNIDKLEGFFDSLCEVSEEPRFGDPPTSIVPRQFRKKALSVMFAFVHGHAKEIEDELREFPSTAGIQDALERLKYLTQEGDHLDHDSTSDSESDGER